MKKLSLLFPLFLIACQGPSDQQCQYNFAVQMFKAVEYRECNKEALIEDFYNYMDWLGYLEGEGELHREQLVNSVPPELKRAKRVFCSRGCSSTHFINGQCFLWKSDQRKNMQDIDRRARLEPEECETKYNWKDLQRPPFIDFDWKNTWKYNRDSTGLGGRMWGE